MISITSPAAAVPESLLDEPGAFAWWYLDAVDAQGDGLVLIWSFGMPFLPGVTAAARANAPRPPRRRPALNVVTYRSGRPDLYLLQAYDAANAGWDGSGTWWFGDSVIRARREVGLHHVEARLRCPIPGGLDALEGTVRLVGVPRVPGVDEPSEAPHAWTPLCGPAWVDSSLRAGTWAFRHAAPAYHDRNASHVPLHALGIDRWEWGRVATADALLVWYLLWPEEGGSPRAHLLHIGMDGRTKALATPDVSLRDGSPSRWGMPAWRALSLTSPGSPPVEVSPVRLSDDGPFYTRRLIDVRVEGRSLGLGWSETVVPARLDRPLLAPLVSMAVHEVGGSSSAWLPLFSGPRSGRLARLGRSWLSGSPLAPGEVSR